MIHAVHHLHYVWLPKISQLWMWSFIENCKITLIYVIEFYNAQISFYFYFLFLRIFENFPLEFSMVCYCQGVFGMLKFQIITRITYYEFSNFYFLT